MPTNTNTRVLVWWLLIQALGATVWWVVLLCNPPARQYFMVPGCPDAMLLSFIVPDMVLFVGGALLAAYATTYNCAGHKSALWLHTGAACYASLFCLTMPVISGGGWLAAGMMLPSLLVTPWLVRKHCLQGEANAATHSRA